MPREKKGAEVSRILRSPCLHQQRGLAIKPVVDLSSLSLGPEGKVHLLSPGLRRSGQAWSKSVMSEGL